VKQRPISRYFLCASAGFVCRRDDIRELAYFFPKQFRGPNENGKSASLLSEAYFTWPTRTKSSGTKLSGCFQMIGVRLAVYVGHSTTVQNGRC
jgi:hypothetical protein